MAWMQSKDGSKNRNRPKPLSPLAKPKTIRTGQTALSPAQVLAALNAPPALRGPDGGPIFWGGV